MAVAEEVLPVEGGEVSTISGIALDLWARGARGWIEQNKTEIRNKPASRNAWYEEGS